MSIIHTTYYTTIPALNFLRGCLIFSMAILWFMCLVNASLGYQLPEGETVVLLGAICLLSWKEKVTVTDGCIHRSFVSQLLPFLCISLRDIDYPSSSSLNVIKADFGYYNWQVQTNGLLKTVMTTGKSDLFALG